MLSYPNIFVLVVYIFAHNRKHIFLYIIESKLASAYQKQSSKLALVLRKAAEMEMRDFDSNSEQDNSFENSRDYSDVYEQVIF